MIEVKKYSSSGLWSGQVVKDFDTLKEAKAYLRDLQKKRTAEGYDATFLDREKTDLEVVADWSADAYRYIIETK